MERAGESTAAEAAVTALGERTAIVNWLRAIATFSNAEAAQPIQDTELEAAAVLGTAFAAVFADRIERGEHLLLEKVRRTHGKNGVPAMPARGTCQRCGCTDDSACRDELSIAGVCGWADKTHTLCTRCARGAVGGHQ